MQRKKIIWCIYDFKKKLQSSCSFDFDDADRLAPCCRWSLLILPSAAENVKKRCVCMIKKICRVRIILRGRYKCCPKAVDVVSKKKRQSRRLCLSQPNLRKNVLALRAVAHFAVTLKAVAKHLDTACERVRLVLSLRVVQIVLLLFHNLFTLKYNLALCRASVNYIYLSFVLLLVQR